MMYKLLLLGAFMYVTESYTTRNIPSIRLSNSITALTVSQAPILPSLIESTLKEIESDELFLQTEKDLKTFGQVKLTLEERKTRHRSLRNLGIPSFSKYLNEKSVSIKRKDTSILQLNIGLYCNQACNHCHVESSPRRTETMTIEVAQQCLNILDNSPSIKTVDITGISISTYSIICVFLYSLLPSTCLSVYIYIYCIICTSGNRSLS